MEFGLGHGSLQAEHQSVVEERWMIEAVRITDQGVSDTAEVEQAVPVRVVAGEPRDLEPEHDADAPDGDLADHASEAAPLGQATT